MLLRAATPAAADRFWSVRVKITRMPRNMAARRCRSAPTFSRPLISLFAIGTVPNPDFLRFRYGGNTRAMFAQGQVDRPRRRIGRCVSREETARPRPGPAKRATHADVP